MATVTSESRPSLEWTGPQLRGFRATRFVTIAALSRALDCSESYIRQIERQAAPSPTFVEKYIDAIVELDSGSRS